MKFKKKKRDGENPTSSFCIFVFGLTAVELGIHETESYTFCTHIGLGSFNREMLDKCISTVIGDFDRINRGVGVFSK